MSAQSHGGRSLDLNLELGDHKVATTLEHVTQHHCVDEHSHIS